MKYLAATIGIGILALLSIGFDLVHWFADSFQGGIAGII